MTKEIHDILFAYKAAHAEGRQTALATVVHVEGSSYRRPGARMLVEDNGRMTGAISGGCLEGDALRKALFAINQQKNKLVTYNTLDAEDLEFGVQLGCNGIVHILFEPIYPALPNHPVALLEKTAKNRQKAVVATLFSLSDYYGHQPGTCLYFDGENSYSKLDNAALQADVMADARKVLTGSSSSLHTYSQGTLAGFVELLQPTISLVIAGGGNDALPMVAMAQTLGWQTTIIDGRSTHATRQRFPAAGEIIVAKPEDAAGLLTIDDHTVVVLMTHNYHYDLQLLRQLLPLNCAYIGVLGPKTRLERMLKELRTGGTTISEEVEKKIYGPTGLDIGAETAEEIALSVLAEVKAVLSGRQGGSLRKRPGGIHSRPQLKSNNDRP